MSSLWVFESLTAEEIDRCVALMQVVVLGAGETLMEEGEQHTLELAARRLEGQRTV